MDDSGHVIWSETTSHVETPSFLRDVHGKLITPDDRSFLGYFSLMITEETWQLIADQTNLYATQVFHQAEKADALWWNSDGTAKETTAEEIRALFGIFLIMSIVNLPTMNAYWQESEPIYYQATVAKVMTCDRFKSLLRYIHLNDNSAMPPQDDPEWAADGCSTETVWTLFLSLPTRIHRRSYAKIQSTRESKLGCKACSVYLCRDGCFKEFHDMTDMWFCLRITLFLRQ